MTEMAAFKSFEWREEGNRKCSQSPGKVCYFPVVIYSISCKLDKVAYSLGNPGIYFQRFFILQCVPKSPSFFLLTMNY